ncbi:MAG: hypothetical protein KKF48_01650 [Nanoarchaeota archaeon]|nr:hypothetical protein [Nanoarchaeota archaeon]MBU1027725.1 hypothetical protein [Nanoarchaeota archaeon]
MENRASKEYVKDAKYIGEKARLRVDTGYKDGCVVPKQRFDFLARLERKLFGMSPKVINC